MRARSRIGRQRASRTVDDDQRRRKRVLQQAGDDPLVHAILLRMTRPAHPRGKMAGAPFIPPIHARRPYRQGPCFRPADGAGAAPRPAAGGAELPGDGAGLDDRDRWRGAGTGARPAAGRAVAGPEGCILRPGQRRAAVPAVAPAGRARAADPCPAAGVGTAAAADVRGQSRPDPGLRPGYAGHPRCQPCRLRDLRLGTRRIAGADHRCAVAARPGPGPADQAGSNPRGAGRIVHPAHAAAVA
ncbi:hypothetical protein G6F61_013434 [Rhizopus arrhizus]|nr:hypothetical protein G6F61_013434 [Rhizopus arrhizus]